MKLFVKILAILIGAFLGLVSAAILRGNYLMESAVIGGCGALAGILTCNAAERLEKRRRNRVIFSPSNNATLPREFNPLFVYNTLHHVTALNLSNPEHSNMVLNHLAALIRQRTEIESAPYTILSQELKSVDLFFTIEKERLGDRFAVDLPHNSSNKEIVVPSSILFPLAQYTILQIVERNSAPIKIGITDSLIHGALILTFLISGLDSPASAREMLQCGQDYFERIEQRLHYAHWSEASFHQAAVETEIRLTFHLPIGVFS